MRKRERERDKEKDIVEEVSPGQADRTDDLSADIGDICGES